MYERRIGSYTSVIDAALDVLDRIRCEDCERREERWDCYEADPQDLDCLNYRQLERCDRYAETGGLS